MKIFLSILTCLLLTVTGCQRSSENGSSSTPDLKIGRMKVSIWPEYDTQGVLVIYEGKFLGSDLFPTKASFILPKGVRELTDACSLSPKGEHFCQLYDVSSKGKHSEVNLKLPYPDFFIDFQFVPFKKGEKRDFDYIIKSNYPIGILEVNIQEPLRSSGFQVTPVASKEVHDRGFNYFQYTYEDVPVDQEMHFNISYRKNDMRPSVDIKYSSMSESGSFSSNKKYIILLVAGILLLILLGYFRYKSARKEKA